MNAPASKPTRKVDLSQATRKHERLCQIILKPVISEKTTASADKHRQIAFRVLPDANKGEIKAAVETLFEVKVQTVQVLHVRGKAKRGRTPGRRKNWKKAYVRLQPGHDIDFLGAASA